MSEKITVYHTTDSYTIHKGPKATCRICKRSRKVPVDDNKKSGSTGGKISGKTRSNPPRKCKGCKKPIHRQSKSGLCLRCLRIRRKRDAVVKAKAVKKFCSLCNRPIARINKTGLCRKCWDKSPKTKAGREQLQAWTNAAVFSRNATTKKNNEKEEDCSITEGTK